MDTGTGTIREMKPEEHPAPTEVILSHAEAAYLEMLRERDRPAEYKELHSHNNNKKRRALRRMQNASRRKNRGR